MDTPPKTILVQEVKFNHISLYCIVTKERKMIEPGMLVSYRVGNSSTKITAMVIQIAAEKRFIVSLCNVPDFSTKYIGRISYADYVRLALPDVIINLNPDGTIHTSEF